MTMPAAPIRVLVVDDSVFMRRALTRLIDEGRGLCVAGEARNGQEALARITALHPDVVTLDIEMPVMDGIQALAEIMQRCPLPVVMLSTLSRRGADITLQCLEMGAVDFVHKPTGDANGDCLALKYLIWQKIRQAASARVSLPSSVVPPVAPAVLPHPTPNCSAQRVVAIGASTGGPRALLEVLKALPADLPAGIVIVQHMPAQFTATMARRFDAECALSVREAQHGDRIRTGVALIAPGGRHLRLDDTGCVVLTDEPPHLGVRPAVDFMMDGIAPLFGVNALGVLLTGMGRDGAVGLGAIRQDRGATIAQDEASCVVYGMPRAAIEAGVVDQVAPLSQIADHIIHWCAGGRRKGRRHGT